MMKVPIILLNYNSSTDCAKCISFLKRQRGVEIEIVVVDNCSRMDDLTRLRVLCESEPLCTLIENHENRGYNAGNNIGLRYAAEKGYKYALIANPDMEFPQEDYVEKMVAKMEEDEEIAVCGSDIVHREGFHQNPIIEDKRWYHCFDWVYSTFFHKGHKYAITTGNYAHTHFCKKLSGCCLMLRMNFVQSINFFDENVFLYCEEGILAKQIERANKKCLYVSDIKAVHNHIKKQKGNSQVALKEWIKSRCYFEKQYNNQYLWQYLIVKSALYLRYGLITLGTKHR